MADPMSFRPPPGDGRSRTPDAAAPLIGLLLLLLGVFAMTRPWWGGRVPEGTLVEVRGDVPRPGHHLVVPPTVEAALTAAGLANPPADARPVPEGHRVRWKNGTAQLQPPSDPLLVGLPIDLDTADTTALTAIPGVGERTAERILADREARGPFRSVDDLERVPGIGSEFVEQLRPFVTVTGDRRVDLATASAPRLELLPGIGEVLAERIVADRARRGAFGSIDALGRVEGIGPTLVERLRPHVRVTTGEPL